MSRWYLSQRGYCLWGYYLGFIVRAQEPILLRSVVNILQFIVSIWMILYKALAQRIGLVTTFGNENKTLDKCQLMVYCCTLISANTTGPCTSWNWNTTLKQIMWQRQTKIIQFFLKFLVIQHVFRISSIITPIFHKRSSTSMNVLV